MPIDPSKPSTNTNGSPAPIGAGDPLVFVDGLLGSIGMTTPLL